MKYMLIVLLTFCFTMQNAFAYDMWNLNWKGAKKNLCSLNIQRAVWLSYSPGNAHHWMVYADKTSSNIEIWDVIIITKHNKALKNNKWGWKYGHVAIATDIDYINWKVYMYDWPNAYWFWTKIENIDWVISETKLIEIWANNIK